MVLVLHVRVLFYLRGCGVGREAAVAHRGNRLHGEIKQVRIKPAWTDGAAVSIRRVHSCRHVGAYMSEEKRECGTKYVAPITEPVWPSCAKKP